MRTQFKFIIGGVFAVLVGCSLADCQLLPTTAVALEVMGGIAIFLSVVTLSAS